MNQALPGGWATATLEEICAKITDGTHQTPSYLDSGVPFVSTANLRPFHRGFDFTEYRRFISGAAHTALTTRCRPQAGDLLVSKCGTIGRVKEVDVDYEFSIFVGLALLKPWQGIFIPGFAEYWLNSPSVTAQFLERAPGSTRRTLTLKGIKTVTIPVPPIEEQRRLLNKLRDGVAGAEQCNRGMTRASMLLTQFRRAVVAAACSGRLTSNWRRANGQDDEWMFQTLSELGEITGGITKSGLRKRMGLTVPYLRVANVYENRLDLDEVLTIGVTQQEFGRTVLEKGDVLFVEGNGSVSQIGRVALWDGSIEGCVHQNHLIKFRAGKRVKPEYVLLQMMGPEGRAQLVERATSSAGLNTLSLSKIGSVSVPVPPLSEQGEIVRRANAFFRLADGLERRFDLALSKVNKILPSLLAKAFRGELVPTEAELAAAEGRAFETATELLERIRLGVGSPSHSAGKKPPKSVKQPKHRRR